MDLVMVNGRDRKSVCDVRVNVCMVQITMKTVKLCKNTKLEKRKTYDINWLKNPRTCRVLQLEKYISTNLRHVRR
jgi:hypothetical protein